MHAEHGPMLTVVSRSFPPAGIRQALSSGKSAVSLRWEGAGHRWGEPISPSLIQTFCHRVRRDLWASHFSRLVCMIV